jgi:hypothetical protein
VAEVKVNKAAGTMSASMPHIQVIWGKEPAPRGAPLATRAGYRWRPSRDSARGKRGVGE